MSAHRELALLVVLLSSRAPRLVKTASLNVMWLLNGSVFVPIHTEMSLSAPIESRNTWSITTGDGELEQHVVVPTALVVHLVRRAAAALAAVGDPQAWSKQPEVGRRPRATAVGAAERAGLHGHPVHRERPHVALRTRPRGVPAELEGGVHTHTIDGDLHRAGRVVARIGIRVGAHSGRIVDGRTRSPPVSWPSGRAALGSFDCLWTCYRRLAVACSYSPGETARPVGARRVLDAVCDLGSVPRPPRTHCRPVASAWDQDGHWQTHSCAPASAVYFNYFFIFFFKGRCGQTCEWRAAADPISTAITVPY